MLKRRAVVSSCLLGVTVVGIAVAGVISAPPPAMGAARLCVLLLNDAGGETLINRCRDCRQVTLSRRRPGVSVPNVREMMLPPVTAMPTPFRGPGRTRIVGDRSCPPPPGSAVARTRYTR